MAVNQNYVGNVANPVTEARLEMALSGPALARRLGLSRQYISRAEQGTYSSLNPALIKWIANAMSWTTRSVEQRYKLFQREVRRATVENVNPHKLERHENKSPGGVLFERWRSGYWNSPTAFSIAFCVHPDSVTKYEEGITKTIPKQIFSALLENGLIEENWADEPPRAEAADARLTA